jgi:hypothetical protein
LGGAGAFAGSGAAVRLDLMNRFGLENLGLGLGLRSKHYAHILEHRPDVDWFELITENYLETRGRSREIAEILSERYPLVLHGVSLSIGSTDPLDLDYVRAVRGSAIT